MDNASRAVNNGVTSANAATSSDEELGFFGSGSSNCSSQGGNSGGEGRAGSGRKSRRHRTTHGDEYFCDDNGSSSSHTRAPGSPNARKKYADEKNRKNARLYMRAVRVLAKMSLLLENPNILVSGRTQESASKKLGKLMTRYDSFLQRLESEVARSQELVNLTAPAGLLNALDAHADPYEWIEKCVVAPFRQENEQSKGVLMALQSYEATILHMLRWGCAERALPP